MDDHANSTQPPPKNRYSLRSLLCWMIVLIPFTWWVVMTLSETFGLFEHQ